MDGQQAETPATLTTLNFDQILYYTGQIEYKLYSNNYSMGQQMSHPMIYPIGSDEVLCTYQHSR